MALLETEMVMQEKLALVTGATGAIGPVLVRLLLSKGYGVRVLVRHSPSPRNLPASVVQVQGDITDREALDKALKDVDVVFHLAAKLHINDPRDSLQSEYRRVNVEGTGSVVDAACKAGVRRLVFFSTISIYGPSRFDEVLDENSEPRPQSLYSHTKCEAEAIVLQARQGTGERPFGVVLRMAAVYGPNVKGHYARLIAALRRGLFVPLGDGRNRRTLIYDEDACAAALLAAEHVAAAGQIYNVTDGSIHPFDSILAAICQAMDKAPPKFHFPATPARILAGGLEDALGWFGIRSSINRSTVDKMIEDVAVKGDKICREIGFRPQFDLAAGWSEALRERLAGSHD